MGGGGRSGGEEGEASGAASSRATAAAGWRQGIPSSRPTQQPPTTHPAVDGDVGAGQHRGEEGRHDGGRHRAGRRHQHRQRHVAARHKGRHVGGLAACGFGGRLRQQRETGWRQRCGASGEHRWGAAPTHKLTWAAAEEDEAGGKGGGQGHEAGEQDRQHGQHAVLGNKAQQDRRRVGRALQPGRRGRVRDGTGT